MNGLHDIIHVDPPRSPPEAWARQQRTAKAIASRFARGYDTVLLADEVGMGKTYVALTAMSQYLFQSNANDRKVLLVTPPGNVLRVKWQQEIQSFNEQYLTPTARARKSMQAITINSYWDLLRNLQDFRNHDVLRVDEESRLCFTWCMFNWAFARTLLGKKRRILWATIDHLHKHHHSVVNFLSHYSVHAIRRFLDADYRVRAHFYQGLFRSLQNGTFDSTPGAGAPRYVRGDIAALFKRFASEQDRHEPNVYVIGMNALTRPRIDQNDNKLLSKYLLAHLLTRRRFETWKTHAMALVQANVLPDEFGDKHAHRWRLYIESMEELVKGEFYGLRDVVLETLKEADVLAEWQPLSDAIMRGEIQGAHGFFNKLGNRVFAAQLARANFGLAVVDEVHNWKSGAFGAQAFRDQYAPGIRHKLLMSATPFQMEEREMAKLFSYVQTVGCGSQAVMQGLYAPDGEIAGCLAASAAFGKT
jgi:hypothetical protein